MWHPTANSVSPEEVTCGSNRRIALICPKCGYGKNGEWRPSIAGACRTGGGCPVCSGKVLVEGVNDVATVHPEIAAQWHPTLNEFPPTRVTSGSARHVYLVCKDCGYGANGEWHPMIAFACGSGEVHTGCPECARNSLRKVMRAHYAKTARKPLVSVACPQIAALWHPENEFGPDMYTTGSCKNIPLVCTACGYGKDKDWTPSMHYLDFALCSDTVFVHDERRPFGRAAENKEQRSNYMQYYGTGFCVNAEQMRRSDVIDHRMHRVGNRSLRFPERIEPGKVFEHFVNHTCI